MLRSKIRNFERRHRMASGWVCFTWEKRIRSRRFYALSNPKPANLLSRAGTLFKPQLVLNWSGWRRKLSKGLPSPKTRYTSRWILYNSRNIRNIQLVNSHSLHGTALPPTVTMLFSSCFLFPAFFLPLLFSPVTLICLIDYLPLIPILAQLKACCALILEYISIHCIFDTPKYQFGVG